MIPEEKINEIRERTDIVDLIGSVLDLKKTGRNYKALCPFHGEKTPSFVVSPDKQIYHCFGCGKGGNAFGFLMEYEGISFVEAAKRLAEKAGMDISRYLGKGGARKRLDPFYHAMEFAGNFYRRTLKENQKAEKARTYLEKRGIEQELVEGFALGYAPPSWDGLYRAAAEAGIPREILLKLKLVMRSRGGSGFRDYFRNRVIFPIHNITGRILGLAGRVLDDSEPKYLNTVESPIYSKSKILYGLSSSKDHIRKSKTAILVEGYMDFLVLWKAGFKNTCAVCGTSFTKEQGRLLARYAKRVYIINDGDRAGVRASVRAADQLLAESVGAKIVTLPPDEDPDSIVTKRGADALSELMESASDYFKYMLEVAEKKGGDRIRKSQVIKHLTDSISRVEDDIDRELYLQDVSELFKIPVETVRAQISGRKKSVRTAEKRSTKYDKIKANQKLLFRFGLEKNKFAEKIVDNLMEDDLEGDLFRRYFIALREAVEEGVDIDKAEFFGRMTDPDISDLASEIAFTEIPPGPMEELLDDTLMWLKRVALKREMWMMKERIRELEEEPGKENAAEEMEIAEAYRKVAREYKKLGMQGGNRLR